MILTVLMLTNIRIHKPLTTFQQMIFTNNFIWTCKRTNVPPPHAIWSVWSTWSIWLARGARTPHR